MNMKKNLKTMVKSALKKITGAEAKKQKQKKDILIQKIMEQSNLEYEEVWQMIEESEKLHSIKGKSFLKYKLWNYPVEEHMNVIHKAKDPQKYDYIMAVCEQYQAPYEDVRARMMKAHKEYGISYEYYMSNYMYSSNERRIAVWGKEQKKAKRTAKKAICEAGYSLKDADNRISSIKSATGKELDYVLLAKYDLMTCSEEEAIARTKVLIEIDNAIAEIRSDYDAPDVEEKYISLRNMMKTILSESQKEVYREKLAKNQEILNREDIEDIFADIQTTHRLLGFSVMEYLLNHFSDMSLAQKRTYMPNKPKNTQLRKLPKGADVQKYIDFCQLCDDKYACYQRFKEEYNRKAVLIASDQDYDAFVEFAQSVPVFMKKRLSGSQGKGVEILKVEDFGSLDELFKEIRQTKKVILEELVTQAPEIAKFNEDSINTFRLITFHDGVKSDIKWGFFRTGRKGSIVDNAGAGGVFASIDGKTGTLNSDGADEAGFRFLTHPDSGLAYRGFAIPEWEKLKGKCCKLADQFPEAPLIGWDFAYNDQHEWIVIEMNCMPELIFQGATGVGVKAELYELIEQRLNNLNR